MFRNSDTGRVLLLTAVLAGSMAASNVFSQSSEATHNSATSATPAVRPGAQVRLVRHLSRRAEMYYHGVWGVDDLKVKQAESGEMIKFTWRVLDPVKAKTLNDKKLKPVLIDPQAGVQLVVPTMEKVGQLRQSSTPEAGKSYWMAFSNSGRPVKRGDRVDVVIGQFKAEGLVVE
jgi:hypothetical protein